MENNRSKNKAARYAVVYNQLLQMIQEGVYPEGSKLLSEPSLAQQLKVSRSTLRQALNLLQEDGIIESRHGVGNFVRKSVEGIVFGLEKMENPIEKSCELEITSKSIEVIPGISTEYTEHIFKRKMPLVIAVHRYYKNKDQVIAYCFSHIASDCQYLNNFDLHNENELLKFLEKDIYSFAQSCRCEIKVVKMSDNLKDKQILQEKQLFQMIRELVIDVNGDVIAVNKFYIPIEIALLKYNAHQI